MSAWGSGAVGSGSTPSLVFGGVIFRLAKALPVLQHPPFSSVYGLMLKLQRWSSGCAKKGGRPARERNSTSSYIDFCHLRRFMATSRASWAIWAATADLEEEETP